MAGGLEQLHGIVPPVCTPMTESYEVDVPSLERLLRFHLDAGVHGIFLLGSTGEAAFLTASQRRQVLDVAVQAVGGQVPVIAGIIEMATASCLERAEEARTAGVDGLVLTPPFYATVSQREIVEHFRAVAASAGLPLIAYDIPPAVHLKIQKETVLQLANEGTIAGLKDSSGDLANFRSVLQAMRDLPAFRVFTGSEQFVDTALSYGASGSVPGMGNVDPEGFVRIYDAAMAGDWKAAAVEQERICRLFGIVSVGLACGMGVSASAFGAFKTALMLRGVISTNVVGRPQTRYSGELIDKIREALVEVDLL